MIIFNTPSPSQESRRTSCLCWNIDQTQGFLSPSLYVSVSLCGGWLRDTPTMAGSYRTFLVYIDILEIALTLQTCLSPPTVVRVCISCSHHETNDVPAYLGGCCGNDLSVLLRHLHGVYHSFHHRGLAKLLDNIH